MVTSFHKSIEDAIIEFGKNSKFVKKVFRGNEDPFSITESLSKKVINYKPDVHFLLKRRRGKLLFQVLRSELKKQEILIADVIRACLVENCDGIIFVYKKSDDKDEFKDDENRILEALSIVRGLYKKGIRLENLPYKNSCVSISEKKSRDKKKIIKLLSTYSREDGWFK
jgi:hypothetical protein